jgi:hypothetical protein
MVPARLIVARRQLRRQTKMRERSKGEGFGLHELGALLVIWLLFYGVLAVHGLTTSHAERLAKAWTIQDNAESVPGAAQALRESLALSADRNRAE